MASPEPAAPVTQANTPWWGDKSFLLVAVGLVVSVLNGKFDLGLNASEIAAMLAAVVAFVVGNKWKSGAITVAEIRAQNALAVAAETKNATPESAARALGGLVTGAPASSARAPVPSVKLP